MERITVTRYTNPQAHGWAGHMTPESASWIMFIGLDGRPVAFLNRDPASGAVLGDDPSERAAHIASLTVEGGNRTGMAADGSVPGDGLAIGEIVYPLGVNGRGLT